MKRAILIFTLFLSASVQCLSGRTWTLRNGETREGEIVKCTRQNLTIVDSDGKKSVFAIAGLSDADFEYLKKNYPEFFGAPKSSKKDDDASEEIEERESSSKWPIISLNDDDIAFRWDSSRGRFYTRHYLFDMKQKIDNYDALDLAKRCESAYEAVRLLPLVPDEMKRKSAALNPSEPHKKFVIEITKIPESGVGGYYVKTFTGGKIISEIVKVEPDQLVKTAEMFGRGMDKNTYLPISTLGHELTHEILSFCNATCALDEGLADFIGHGLYSTAAVFRFDLYPKMLDSEKYFENGRGKKKIMLPSLKKFLTMPKRDFYRSNRRNDNYKGALLVVIYFYLNDPETFKEFLASALDASGEVKGENENASRCAKVFPILLKGGKEEALEKKITAFYATHSINIEFR